MIGHYTTGLRRGHRASVINRCPAQGAPGGPSRAFAGSPAPRQIYDETVRAPGDARMESRGASASGARGPAVGPAPVAPGTRHVPGGGAAAVERSPIVPIDWRTAITVVGVTLPVVVGLSTVPEAAVTGYLPQAAYDLLLSFTRMVLAYGLSLGFALGYGYLSASNRPAERVMIPTLDILQSVPIIGFFPVVLLIFVNLLPGSWAGPNLASIFLIFTSMSWNMVFGVYRVPEVGPPRSSGGLGLLRPHRPPPPPEASPPRDREPARLQLGPLLDRGMVLPRRRGVLRHLCELGKAPRHRELSLGSSGKW